MGLLFAIGAAPGFSAKAIFVKLAYQYDVDPITLLMFCMMVALLIFIVFAYVQERKTKQRIMWKNFAFILFMGLIGYYMSSLLKCMGMV